VDNICHTLAGAALARTGLGRRTALGAATMMIGANLPDIDILSAFFGRSVEFRRGWTHGVLALVVLPFLLTGIMIAWDRYARKDPSRDPVVPRQLLLLSAISILTHPTLDWMNSYGLRWLMPFDGTWFYGDALFIVDPWLWTILGLGVFMSRRREKIAADERAWKPARLAVAIASAYIVAMMIIQSVAESRVRKELAGTGFDREKLVVTAAPANPARWRVHADDGARYRWGSFNVVRDRIAFADQPLEKGAEDPRVAPALRDPAAAPFVNWARLPFYRVGVEDGRTVVRITDARYGASIAVPVPSKP
jgi:inner membrane protein